MAHFRASGLASREAISSRVEFRRSGWNDERMEVRILAVLVGLCLFGISNLYSTWELRQRPYFTVTGEVQGHFFSGFDCWRGQFTSSPGQVQFYQRTLIS